MRHVPLFIASAAVAVAFPVLTATAMAQAVVQPFDQAAFEAAQKANRPFLVWVYAPWCPVCRQQQKIIDRVTAEPAMHGMQVFRIDYDSQKALWKKFGATQQSTLIAYRGRRETGRIAHETDDAKVSSVIRGAIA